MFDLGIYYMFEFYRLFTVLKRVCRTMSIMWFWIYCKNLNKTIQLFRHITEFSNEIKDDSDNGNENKYYEKCELSNNTHGESNCINCCY